MITHISTDDIKSYTYKFETHDHALNAQLAVAVGLIEVMVFCQDLNLTVFIPARLIHRLEQIIGIKDSLE